MRWNLKPRFILNGILKNVKDINDAIRETYGIREYFDKSFSDWKLWVEYKDGNTVILYNTAYFRR